MAEIESTFHEHFKNYISENNVPFKEPRLQQTTDEGQLDMFVESPTKKELVIEFKDDNNENYLLAKENIKQAKDYAKFLDHTTFALANSQDLFLFDYNKDEVKEFSEIDSYYLNLREYKFKEIPEKVLQ